MHRSIDRRLQRGNKCFLLGYCFHTYLLLPVCSQICSHLDSYSDIERLCGNPRLAVGHTPEPRATNHLRRGRALISLN